MAGGHSSSSNRKSRETSLFGLQRSVFSPITSSKRGRKQIFWFSIVKLSKRSAGSGRKAPRW